MQQTLQLIHPQTFFKILPCRYHQIPTKIKQNPKSPPPNHLSYPISSNPTKIKHFPSFTTQKSNPHPAKNLPTIPKSSLFVDTFTDNVFSPQNRPNHLSPHPQHRGVLKNYTQNYQDSNRTVLFLCQNIHSRSLALILAQISHSNFQTTISPRTFFYTP